MMRAKQKLTLSKNMLQIENEYETPIESNYYQNNKNHFKNSDNTQSITENTEEHLKEVQRETIYIRIQQIKYSYERKKLDNTTSLRKSRKQRFSITRTRN